MKVDCNPKANFPLSIQLIFDSGSKEQYGMWFDVGDAWYLVRELLKAITKQKAAEQSVQWMGLLARIGQWFGAIAHH